MTHPGWVTLISNYPLEIAKSQLMTIGLDGGFI